MKKNALLVLVCILWVGLLGGVVQAQDAPPNLLINPSFEAPYLGLSANPPGQKVAQGWNSWYVSGGQSESENIPPEYYPASDTKNGLGKPRIKSGSDAQQFFSFFATIDGGLYQQVSGITPGTQLTFSSFVYVWSSSFGDNLDLSDNPGGVVVQVGIDPNGGVDGTSANVVWSSVTGEAYDAYNGYSVTTKAAANTVTVFIRATVSVPVMNNNIYIDDASLTAGGGVAPTAEVLPTNTIPVAATNTVVVATITVPAANTNTAVAPINTAVVATNTVAPTNTVVVLTNTSVPATATNLPPTASPIPPTNTSVPVVPSATNAVATVAATNTSASVVITVVLPTNTATSAAIPPTQEVLPSATTIPTNAVTATLAATNTPAPSTPFSNDLPGKVFHTVNDGDTVGQLAALYGSTIDAIIQANALNAFGFIRTGQTLIIPVKLLSPATSTPTNTPVAPVSTPLPPAATATVSNGSGSTVYIVQVGDTLSRIAARFNTTMGAIAQLNGITNFNLIRWGQPLLIPTGNSGSAPAPTATPAAQPRVYVVQTGDTLFTIALRFQVTINSIAQANNISNPNRVFVGQRLVIP